jgi:hypothetical protein
MQVVSAEPAPSSSNYAQGLLAIPYFKSLERTTLKKSAQKE